MKINGIEWKPVTINGELTPYIASEFGNVMNTVTGHMMTASKLQVTGRPRMCLHYNGKKKDVKVYRIIYEAFHGPIPKDMTVDHIDGNFNNNCISNLQLLTPAENSRKYYRDNPDKGFGKKYPNSMIEEFFKLAKEGKYYLDIAYYLDIDPEYASHLLRGNRRKYLWELYQPFPDSAYYKTKITKSTKKLVIGMLLDGKPTKEILREIGMKHDLNGINLISHIRSQIPPKNERFFEQNILADVDKLILEGKTNAEICKIIGLNGSSGRISDMLTRRRHRYGIPNVNVVGTTKEEYDLIDKYISEGLSNQEILEKIGKERSSYYINLFGRLRRKYRKNRSSTTIENAATGERP